MVHTASDVAQAFPRLGVIDVRMSWARYHQVDTAAGGNVLDVPSDAFAISYMKNENHSCAENYGIAPPCREYFAANAFTGAMGASVAGSSYDCRSRAWYFKTKEAEKRRW